MIKIPAGSVSVDGDITAFSPSDGLFLRAEHLRAIETYAQDLIRTVGMGTGTGVVYGFDVALDAAGPALKVQPGLAISPVGQTLRSTAPVVLPLAAGKLEPIGDDGFWRITVNPSSRNYGSENAYGNLCAEPCSGSGSAIQPWTAEGVTISLIPDEMPDLKGIDNTRRRSWLASKFFERERKAGHPWIVPGDATIVPSLSSHDWTVGIGQPSPYGVPIGVIQLVNGEWLLDVWTARRDIGGPPADSAWRSRLGMRPWNVFLAEVLQFQDQLAPLMSAESAFAKEETIELLIKVTKAYREAMPAPGKSWGVTKTFGSNVDQITAPYILAANGASLWQHGFDELPPAGFIAGVNLDTTLEGRLNSLFRAPDQVDLRICNVRADYVPGAIERAQHLDRIPLNSQYPPVGVDILVPDKLADLSPLRTDKYGWVAFVRRSEADCAQVIENDTVELYRLRADSFHLDQFNPTITLKPLGEIESDLFGQLNFPAGSWEYPGSEYAADIMDLAGTHAEVTVVTYARTKDRLPLATLRGSLFGASLDNGRACPPVWSFVLPTDAEAIVVVITPVPE